MHISQTSDKTINSTINPEIKRVIPQTCKLKNPIPTTQNKSSFTSCNSLFNWCQFFCDLLLWASLFSIIIMIVNVPMPHFGYVVTGVSFWLIIIFWVHNVRVHWNDINRIICLPLTLDSNRIFSLNYIFDTKPNITLYIVGYHDEDKRDSGVEVTFQKKQELKLNMCDTVIQSDCGMNITGTKEIYNNVCYHFQFNILLQFDTYKDRKKYIKIISSFTKKNIFDAKQRLEVIVDHELLGVHQNSTDNHGYVLVINSDKTIYASILKIIAGLCTILCVSWLYKIPLYLTQQRKRLSVFKYLSIDELGECSDITE